MGKEFQDIFLEDQLLFFLVNLIDQPDMNARLPLKRLHESFIGFIEGQALDGGGETPFFLGGQLDLNPGFFQGFQEFEAKAFQFFKVGQFKINDVDFLF